MTKFVKVVVAACVMLGAANAAQAQQTMQQQYDVQAAKIMATAVKSDATLGRQIAQKARIDQAAAGFTVLPFNLYMAQLMNGSAYQTILSAIIHQGRSIDNMITALLCMQANDSFNFNYALSMVMLYNTMADGTLDMANTMLTMAESYFQLWLNPPSMPPMPPMMP